MSINTTLASIVSRDEDGDVPVNRTFRLFLVQVTGALCVILNSLNIAVLRRAPQCFGDSTTLLFTALGVVDLTTGVIIMISEGFYVLTDVPNNGPLFCVLVYPFVVLLGILSAMLLACLSFDKLIAITRPLRYPNLVTRKRVKCVIAGVVTLGAMNMAGLWFLILKGTPEKTMYFHSKSLFCRMHMIEDDGRRSNAITLLQTFGFLCMFLPLIVVTYVNLRLLFIVYQSNKRQSIAQYASNKRQVGKGQTSVPLVNGSPHGSSGEHRKLSSPSSLEHPGPRKDRRTSSRVSLPLINLNLLRKHRGSTVSTGSRTRRKHYKGLRTVLVMVVAYYLAWMPLLVDTGLNIILNEMTTPTVEFVVFAMAYSNSWWNAVVYLIMNGTYRRSAYSIIRCDRY